METQEDPEMRIEETQKEVNIHLIEISFKL